MMRKWLTPGTARTTKFPSEMKAKKKTDGVDFLSTEELSARWKGEVQTGTLENWRTMKLGPKFVKLGRGRNSRVVYRLTDVIAYEKANTKGVQP